MPEKTSSTFRFHCLVYAGLFFLAVFLQWKSGAWQSDFGGHADEGAHVVTSLMVRDYLAGGWREELHPLLYAQLYYDQFPKVAIGHYPPVFYGLASLPLLFFRSPASILFLMSALSAGVGWMTWRLAERVFRSRFLSIAVAVLFCGLPLIQTYTAIVMSDLALVLFCLLSVEAFGRFLIDGKVMDSLGFGFWAAVAILTKGSGLGLALLPPIVLLVLRDWKRVKDFRLWLAIIPVLVLAFPWMWFTREITSEGMQRAEFSTYFAKALPYYLLGICREVGWIFAISAGVSLVLLPADSGKQKAMEEKTVFSAVLLAFALANLLLLIALPTGLDRRYLLPVLPPVLILGGWIVLKVIAKQSVRVRVLTISAVCLISLANVWRPVEKSYSGSDEAIKAILTREAENEGRQTIGVLVVTNARGEGALTASAAFLGKGEIAVERGSKLLATSDWLGREYGMTFETKAEFGKLLKESGIRYVIVEQLPVAGEVPDHWRWVAQEMGVAGALETILSRRQKGRTSAFEIYESPRDWGKKGAITPPERAEIER